MVSQKDEGKNYGGNVSRGGKASMRWESCKALGVTPCYVLRVSVLATPWMLGDPTVYIGLYLGQYMG